MAFPITYLVQRLLYRVIDFLYHWYVHSAKLYTSFVLDLLSNVDRKLAWKVTFHHFFEPLYQDYSLIGRVLGFVFRLLRLAGGLVVYAVIFTFAVALYIIWVLIIPYLLLRVFIG